uniref:Large polyvalent protein associated domain-containing protein n=1 Tax=Desulfovibrio sp. U5L TaxID=596152 RepID=I2Q018_9BACT
MADFYDSDLAYRASLAASPTVEPPPAEYDPLAHFDALAGQIDAERAAGKLGEPTGVVDMSQFQPAAKPAPDRGWLGDMGASVARGVYGVGETGAKAYEGVGRAAKDFTGVELPGTQGAGELAESIGKARDEAFPISRAASESGARSVVSQGVESAATSMTPALAGAGAGAVLGSVVPGIGTAIGAGVGGLIGLFSGVPTFAAAQYRDTMKQAEEKGVDPEKAKWTALVNAASEGGTELLSDVVAAATGGTGKVLTAVGKDALKAGISPLLKQGWKPMLKNMGKVFGTEASSELLNSGIQAEANKAAGIDDKGFWDAVAENAGPVGVASLIFSTIGGGMTYAGRRRIENALTNPEVHPAEREAAVKAVTGQLADIDPVAAKVWDTSARTALADGQAIPLDEDFIGKDEARQATGKAAEAVAAAAQPQSNPVAETLAAAGLADKPEWQQALAEFDQLSGNQQAVEQATTGQPAKPREVVPEVKPSGDGGDDSYQGVQADAALAPALNAAFYEPGQVDAAYQGRIDLAKADAEATRLSQAEPFPQGQDGFLERAAPAESPVVEPAPAPKVLSPAEQRKADGLAKRVANLTSLLAVERNPAARARIEETRTGYEVELRSLTGEAAAVLSPEEQTRAEALRLERETPQVSLPQGQGFDLVGEPQDYSQAENASLEPMAQEAAQQAEIPTVQDVADFDAGKDQTEAEMVRGYQERAMREAGQERSGLWKFLAGRLDAKSISDQYGKAALEDLRSKAPRSIFAGNGNGVSFDKLEQEAKSQGILNPEADMVDTLLTNVTTKEQAARDQLSGLGEQRDFRPVEPSALQPEAEGMTPLNSDGTVRDGVQYSTGSEAVPRSHTVKDVQKAFPTGVVTETPDGHAVALPNGETIHVNRVGEISLDDGVAQSGGYAAEEVAGATPVASFKPIDGGGLISLTEAGGQELPHEVYHAAESMALTPREVAAVEREHGNAEGRARAYQEWLAGKGEDKTGVFAKIKEFFQRIREWIAPTAEGTFRKVAGGEVWSREARQAIGGEQYKLSTPPGAASQPAPTFDDPSTETRYREATKGIADQRGIVEKAKEWLGEQKAGFTRHFIHMPNTPEFSEAHEALRQLEAAPTVAKEVAVRNLKKVTGNLSPGAYDLFTRKVILDDLTHEATLGHSLPYGFTPESLAKEKAKIDQAADNTAEVKAALAQRKTIMDDLAGRLVKAGILSADQVKNPAYFRHEVLEYAREWQVSQGTGGALKKPKPGYAKGREGSEKDISANYLEVEYAFQQRALVDLKTAETLEKIKAKYDQKPALELAAKEANARALAALGVATKGMTEAQKREALGAKYKTWADIIPEGYERFQADKGLVYHTGNSITDKAMLSLMDALQMDEKSFQSQAPEVVLDVLNGVRQQIMVGGKKPEMVLPKGMVDTLNNLRPKQEKSFFDQALSKPLGLWKQWVLINPRRVLKYNLNNMAGDLDAVIAGNPKAIKRMPEAIRELRAVMKGGEPSQEYMDAVERGVFDSGLSVQEIPDVARLDAFQNLMAEKAGKNNPMTWIGKGWRGLQDFTQFRENWLRLAAYKDYLTRINAGEDMKSIGYGAADPKMVDALSDPRDKAALLARSLVGDYGAVSHYGQGLRNKVIPFYSWMEVNAKRYNQLVMNAFDQGIGQGLKAGGLTAGMLGARASIYLGVRMAAMYALIGAYNHLFHGEDEEKLSELDRQQLHVILGHDNDGNIHTIKLQGALSDFLSWFGYADAVSAMKQVQNGRGSYGDVLKAMAKAPVNKIAGGLTPLLKTPLELASGHSLYPDVFNPRPMQDKGKEAARLFSLDNEYDAAMSKPTRGYWKSWAQAVDYSRNVGEISYNNTMDLVRDFKESKGIEGAGSSSSPKSRLIREYKLAQRYGDDDAAKKALAKMQAEGVTADDMEKSLIRSAPLAGIARKDRAEFMARLTPKEQDQIKSAEAWYKDTFLDGDMLKSKYDFHEMQADYNVMHKQERELTKAGQFAEANKLKIDNGLYRKGNLISIVERIRAQRKKVADSRLPEDEKVRRIDNFDQRIKEAMDRAMAAVGGNQ